MQDSMYTFATILGNYHSSIYRREVISIIRVKFSVLIFLIAGERGEETQYDVYYQKESELIFRVKSPRPAFYCSKRNLNCSF